MQSDGVDSDGDGDPDADEIIKGTDPNEPGSATGYADPNFGCTVAGRSPPGAAVLAGAGLALGLLIRRRRR